MFDPNFRGERQGTQIKVNGDERFRVTASFKAAVGRAGFHRPTGFDLVEVADRCLFRAKSQGCRLACSLDSHDENLLMEAKMVRVQFADGAAGSNRSANVEVIA